MVLQSGTDEAADAAWSPTHPTLLAVARSFPLLFLVSTECICAMKYENKEGLCPELAVRWSFGMWQPPGPHPSRVTSPLAPGKHIFSAPYLPSNGIASYAGGFSFNASLTNTIFVFPAILLLIPMF